MPTYRALCQGCLRAPTFATTEEQAKAHSEEIMCVCGEQLCACGWCLDTIKRLEAGERGAFDSDLTCAVTEWTAEEGMTARRNLEEG